MIVPKTSLQHSPTEPKQYSPLAFFVISLEQRLDPGDQQKVISSQMEGDGEGAGVTIVTTGDSVGTSVMHMSSYSQVVVPKTAKQHFSKDT